MNRLVARSPIRILTTLNSKLVRVSSARSYADGFTFLLPDIPNDDASNNYLLNIPKQGELIDFQKVDPHQSFRAVLKTLFEHEGCFEELTALDVDRLDEITFDKFYNEIDRNIAHLNYAYSMFTMMSNFSPERFQLRKSGNVKLLSTYNLIRESAYKSKTVFKLMLELNKQSDKLTEEQKRVVKKYLTAGKLNGLHLKTDLAVDQLKRGILVFEENFIENINTHSRNFIQKIINPEYVKTVPGSLRSMVQGKSVVNLYFSPLVYEHFLANCNDQHARYEYWYAYNNRASLINAPRNIVNNIVVDEIIVKRRQLADHLGFINYIEYKLQDRTLDSIMTIKDFIEKLFEQTRDVYRQDLDQIAQFAASTLDFKAKFLNLWDLPYFSTQLRNQTLAPLNKDINHYFPVQKVIAGIFKFLETNLNVKIERVNYNNDQSADDNPLGATLEYYRVYHNDRFVGNFYLNLYSKTKGAHIRSIADRCDQLDVTPIIGLFFNYDKPFEGQQLTLSFTEVISLFRSFGLLVDHLLPKHKYAEISGINSINKDFKELTMDLFTLFAIHDYDVIKECSQHVFTREPLPKEHHRQYVDALFKYRSFNLTEEIYRMALDFAFYAQSDAWIDTDREIFNKYMSPFDFGRKNFHMCSDLPLLIGPNAGAYYSKLYCQTLAADLFMLTHDNQGNNQSRYDLLNSYVNNFLLSEHGSNDLEAFRKIRGRDFSLKPFLTLNQYTNRQQQNLDKAKVSS